MIDWRQSRIIAATIVVLFLAVQLTIPVARVSDDRGQRFGWQMYSRAVRATPEFVVMTSDGEITIELDDYLPTSRIEVDPTQHLPMHLCVVIDDAEHVLWENGSHQC